MSNKESINKTVMVALLLCIVCSIVVSSSVVLLKPVQQKNKALNLKANILAAAGLLQEGASAQEIEERFASISAKLVDLDTGEYVEPSAVGKDAALAYDQRKAAKDPSLSEPIPSDKDIASIKRRVDYAKVYLVEKDNEIETIILPVSGYGLWSTLHGFLALEGDANTVVGLGFYEHAETPGLGGEVDNPRWKAIWPGKKVYDLDEGDEPKLQVVKGAVDKSRDEAIHQVDGLSGATLTSRGITNLVRYWTGAEGFQQYLNKIREGV
ncbi:MAG: Na(+)-translocating NADH-quinone reductase subunit C [Oleiphilus sp.]|nr:MAG: Na(+)-translocating NADH-quinone reductase subunit C [Oleiphilus sp.]